MDMNGNGLNGGERNATDVSFGPFSVQRRQMRVFGALTFALGAIIMGFMAWHSAASGEAETWHAIIADVIDGFLWRGLTAAAIAIMGINTWEAKMGKINPLAILGTGSGPKWWRDRIEYADERVAEAKAEFEETLKVKLAEAEARGRELGRREERRAREAEDQRE